MTAYTRHLEAGETPPPGSLMFPHSHSLVGWLIGLGEGFDHDLDGKTSKIPTHVYIVAGPPNADGEWDVAEAGGSGFIRHYVAPRTGDPLGHVWLDPAVGKEFAAEACHMATRGLRYDWWAIFRQVVRGLGALAHVQGIAQWLLTHVIAPNDNPLRVICSEAGAILLERVLGRDPRLEPTWKETPLDLWDYLNVLSDLPSRPL